MTVSPINVGSTNTYKMNADHRAAHNTKTTQRMPWFVVYYQDSTGERAVNKSMNLSYAGYELSDKQDVDLVDSAGAHWNIRLHLSTNALRNEDRTRSYPIDMHRTFDRCGNFIEHASSSRNESGVAPPAPSK